MGMFLWDHPDHSEHSTLKEPTNSPYTHLDESGGVHNDVIKQHTWSVVLRPFWWSRNAFGDESLWQKYFTGNIEAIWPTRLKLRSKIEDKDLSVCLTLRTSLLLLLVVFMSFSWAFYHKNVAFFPEIYLWIYDTPRQATIYLALFPLMDQSSVHLWRVEFACKFAFLQKKLNWTECPRPK